MVVKDTLLNFLAGFVTPYLILGIGVLTNNLSTPDNFSWKTGDTQRALNWLIASAIFVIVGYIVAFIIYYKKYPRCLTGFIWGIMSQGAIILYVLSTSDGGY